MYYVCAGEQMIEVVVKNILFYARSATPGYTLLLQAAGDETRSLPIVVGQFEAQAIALVLEQIRLERPMTHDLLSHVIDHLAGGLDSVIIKKLEGGTFYAELVVRDARGLQQVDARPSDAIALALRSKVPIRVSRDVYEAAAIPTPGIDETREEPKNSFEDNVSAITRRAEMRFDLERDLKEAIALEDYEKAALIRDRLNEITLSE